MRAKTLSKLAMSRTLTNLRSKRLKKKMKALTESLKVIAIRKITSLDQTTTQMALRITTKVQRKTSPRRKSISINYVTKTFLTTKAALQKNQERRGQKKSNTKRLLSSVNSCSRSTHQVSSRTETEAKTLLYTTTQPRRQWPRRSEGPKIACRTSHSKTI